MKVESREGIIIVMQKKRREISPALNATVDEYIAIAPPPVQGIIARIRAEKESNSRPRPSASIVDKSALLTPGKRLALLDKVAELVDENVAGRSDMCLQSAKLLSLALNHLGLRSHAVIGRASYMDAKGKRIFSWDHGWVRVGKEMIDGNTDSICENPTVPAVVRSPPYWGPNDDAPARKYEQSGYVDDDPDVLNIWWPDLREWLDKDFTGID